MRRRAGPAPLLLAVGALALLGSATAMAAGPPFPDPEPDRAVYDTVGVFTGATIQSAESTIDAIENRTGAEVVVYTQLVDYGITAEEAETHAKALIDQWGIGRKGFDDGLVILYDLDPSREHGQVQLYAGAGYKAAFLSDGERQALFDDEMLPLLRDGNLDGALLVALDRINANATPEHAARLQAGRQLDAVVGLVGAPTVFLGLLGWGVMSWRRYGKDPVYLDSPSIHLPAPPPDLTAAAGAVVQEGRVTRRALTAALMDLASRGLLSFREEKGVLGIGTKVGIETAVPEADPVTEAHRARNGRRPISRAEAYALERLRGMDTNGYIEPEEVVKFGSGVDVFNERLERHVVKQGWFRERPEEASQRWVLRGTVAAVLGGVLIVVGANLPSAGLLLLGGAAVAGGVALMLLSRAMPAVTVQGAMIRAMLAAYRRTLAKTMAQARSMQQVVEEARLPWLETPDQAVVWGLALGLEGEVEKVLDRTLDDVRDGRATGSTWVPGWYHSGSGGSNLSSSGGGGASGLISSSALPNFGGMMGALGTIGNSPSSSGSGGGFGGGGSSGGGGAGGGF